MKKSVPKILPLAIIGAGPGGLTAAIYAQRSNIKPIVFTDEIIGGKAAKTLLIENYPGFASMNGMEFCDHLSKQADYLQIKFVYEKILKISQRTDQTFLVETKQKHYFFEKVIIATGTKERKLPAEGVERLHGRGVSYCSSCDGYFFKDLIIAVIGGGNSAIEESKILAKIGKKVIIINRDDQLTAEKRLIDEIQALDNVEIKQNSILVAAQGKDKLEQIVLENVQTKQQELLTVDGLFIYIGSIPNTGFLAFSNNILDANDYIITNQHFATTIPNLYAIGDVVSGHIQQYTTAVGSATIALKDIIARGFKNA